MATTTRNTASKKRQNGTRSDEFTISNIEISIENIRCSVCNRISDKQIFSCLRGHLNCDICKQGNGLCLREQSMTCYQALTRSIVSEKLLDKITFKCPWANLGCEGASIRRCDLTSHKKDCESNPNFLNCSQLCHIKCDFRFCTVSVNDEDGIKEMKDHLKSHHHDLSIPDTIFSRGTKEDNFLIRELENKIYVTEVLNFDVDGEALGTFMVVWLVEKDANEVQTISRYFVSLTENNIKDSKAIVQLRIKSQPKSDRNIMEKSLPDLEWQSVIWNTREFRKILEMPKQERKEKNFSIPIPHLQDYYVNADDEVNVEFSVLRVPIERQEKRMRTSIDS